MTLATASGAAVRALPFLVLLALAIPVAAAQNLIAPITGDFGSTYLVYGRAIDADGKPIVNGAINATLSAPNVIASPTTFGTDCYGFFIGSFNLHDADPRGAITVTLEGPGGKATATHDLDPFYRRTDFTLVYPATWHGAPCTDRLQPIWEGRVSVSGRLVERVPAYSENGATLNAKPHLTYLHLTWVDAHGDRICPPQGDAANNVCEPIPTDERGDFRYSWTFNESVDPSGHVEVGWGNGTANLTIDPKARMAFGEIEVTGQGPAPIARVSPLPPAPLAIAAVALGALVARRLLPRHPR
ncbi:MAG: hypothetical protein QOE90_2925 [Thermoplasmata archaeon]|jgi:hypothetical protein|nr:hypothetical protein [Thermoplasmata archaeon]